MHILKTPLVKDHNWCRPGHVIFVSFPSTFSFTCTRACGHVSGRGTTENIVAPTILCVGSVKKQKEQSKQNLKTKSKCCYVPLAKCVWSCHLCKMIAV